MAMPLVWSKSRCHAAALDAMATTQLLIVKKCYRDAGECLRTAMELYPSDVQFQPVGFALLFILDTLYYGNMFLTADRLVDAYSVLHLSPSMCDDDEEILKRRDVLQRYAFDYCSFNLSGSLMAYETVGQAASYLTNRTLRRAIDNARAKFVYLDWSMRQPILTTPEVIFSSNFKETYLNWKPPVYSNPTLSVVEIGYNGDGDGESQGGKEEKELVVRMWEVVERLDVVLSITISYF